MLEQILQIDTEIFQFVNAEMSNIIMDLAMPIITSIKYWTPVYIIGFLYLFIKFRWKGLFYAFMIVLTVGLANELSSRILKEFFARPRPCHTLSGDDIRLLVGCGGGKSFPSSHATNNFALATILTYYFRKNRYWFYGIAATVAFSRVYVGVHYPIDITGGAILGTSVGFLITLLAKQIDKKWNLKPEVKQGKA